MEFALPPGIRLNREFGALPVKLLSVEITTINALELEAQVYALR